jgi:hypothetical protein
LAPTFTIPVPLDLHVCVAGALPLAEPAVPYRLQHGVLTDEAVAVLSLTVRAARRLQQLSHAVLALSLLSDGDGRTGCDSGCVSLVLLDRRIILISRRRVASFQAHLRVPACTMQNLRFSEHHQIARWRRRSQSSCRTAAALLSTTQRCVRCSAVRVNG